MYAVALRHGHILSVRDYVRRSRKFRFVVRGIFVVHTFDSITDHVTRVESQSHCGVFTLAAGASCFGISAS